MQLHYLGRSIIDNYPSGSTITSRDGKLYLMGDDARNLLVMDSSLRIIDSLSLFPGKIFRIPKPEKADLEASEWIGDRLFLFGSGSLQQKRDSCFIFNPSNRKTERLELSSLYKSFKNAGLQELNIEGVCLLNNLLLFANRSNLSQKDNHLIIVPKGDALGRVSKVVLLKLPGHAGVSGLSYSAEQDLLLLTASEEETVNAQDDGAIGESYIGIVKSASRKLKNAVITPDEWLRLSDVEPDFVGQKIESACLISVGEDTLMYLVADNDDGNTMIFKFKIK